MKYREMKFGADGSQCFGPAVEMKPDFYCASRVSSMHAAVASVVRACSKCHEEVWIAEQLLHIAESMPIVCLDCVRSDPKARAARPARPVTP